MSERRDWLLAEPHKLCAEMSGDLVSKEAATAAHVGDLPALKAYLDEDRRLVNLPTIFQSKLLHIACKNGQLEIARYLISAGANIAALDYGEHIARLDITDTISQDEHTLKSYTLTAAY